MPTTIHECQGVMLQVQHIPGSKEQPLPTIESVYALDSAYKPCGPDLTPLLDALIIATGVTIGGHTLELSPFLSYISEEITHDRTAH